MARSGPSRDGADGLIDIVVASIAILLLALLGLIIWLNTQVPATGTADDPGSRTALAEEAAAEGDAADVEIDGDTAADAAGTRDGAASGSPAAQAGAGPRGAGGGDDGGAGRGPAGTGLFSADDPSRVPAVTVASAARGERVRRADLDGDGVDERVWAAIVRDRVVIRVEEVVDGVWTPRTTHGGAPADRLLRLALADVNEDGEREVHTVQWVATEGESVTLWSVSDGDLVPMEAVGGCWDGGNTLGIVGTMVRTPDSPEPTIAAICPVKGQPRQRWPSALYRWDDGHWMYDGARDR